MANRIDPNFVSPPLAQPKPATANVVAPQPAQNTVKPQGSVPGTDRFQSPGAGTAPLALDGRLAPAAQTPVVAGELGFEATHALSALANIPAPKDGPVDPSLPKRPQGPQHGPIIHYEWWVTEGLARGDQPTAKDVAKLKSLGFKSIINLRSENDADRAACQQAGLNYLQLPIVDGTVPTQAQMKQFLDFATDPANGPAFVHCQAGHNRTGVAVACYQMAVEGKTADQAIADGESFGLHLPNQEAFIRQFGADLAAGKIAGYPLTAPPPTPTPTPQPSTEAKGSASPNAPITPGAAATSTIHLDQNVDISKLTVGLNLSHSHVSGLTVTVTSPAGTTATLPIQKGSSVQGTFDLSAFAGEHSQGDWKLTVSDSLKSDKGTLQSWNLDILGHQQPTPA